jgi:hypothetical protein
MIFIAWFLLRSLLSVNHPRAKLQKEVKHLEHVALGRYLTVLEMENRHERHSNSIWPGLASQ